MSEESPALEPIAIVGMSGRFPGAENVDAFWKNLVAGQDSITRFSADETEYSVADGVSGKIMRARGVLANPEFFDAEFFGIYPREAEIMDPQHRVFLECAWEAIEQAGYDPETYPGLIGVYAGLSLNTYLLYNLCGGTDFASRLAGNYQVGEYPAMLGNDKDFMPTRLAYKMNLRGPAMAVQTACSTSLVAVAQACTALQTWQCDMALAGGVSISFPQRRDYRYEEDGMVSPDGTCRSFDAEARGTVFGHGSAVVLLKRLSDAQADGDTVLGVIRGCAVNNDGSQKIGYAAPSVEAQAEVIALAQASAGVTPDSISYIEAHGTGTPLGDPIEVAALTKAFRDGGSVGNEFCLLGTGKTHIGHLDVASGVTGLIKTILQLQHGIIPPLLHFRSPNPRIDFPSTPFRPVTQPVTWERNGTPRRAGVSSFGVGGTNAHVVVEEAPEPAPAAASRSSQPLVLSARTPAALQKMALNLAAHLESRPDLSLADVAFTLANGRRSFSYRRAVSASSFAAAAEALRQPAQITPGENPRIVFLFPGQGAQQVDMGRALYENEKVFRAEVDRCAEILLPLLGEDIRVTLYPAPETRTGAEARLNRTGLAQPAIFVVEYALARQWMAWGIIPDALVGHSVGEYVAAVLADTFTLSEALALLAERARLMQDLPGGAMLTARISRDEITAILPAGVEIAAVNSPKLTTVSGTAESITAFQKTLESQKIVSLTLSTSHAFHSAMMEPIVDAFAKVAAATPGREPKIPWISTCTGTWISAADLADPAYWSRQLRQPVLFSTALSQAGQAGYSLFLECGPGQSLVQLVRQNPDCAHAAAVASLSDDGTTSSALGRLWCHGIPPNWAAWFDGETRSRVPLPTYPFERKRFWVEPVPAISRSENYIAEPEPPPPAEIEVVAPENRQAWIGKALARVIEGLSGLSVKNEQAKFVELGFDSLFLTQASHAILTRFGVKVTFRQLLGEFSSIAALAQHLDAVMPPETLPQPVRPASGETGSRLPVVRRRQTDQPAPAASKRFGPYKPPEQRSGDKLTAVQEKALAALIARYTARTGGSKLYTAEHRPHYADPRAVSGFHPQWKEMVYPIVSDRSKGSKIWDVDGNAYVDITMGFGTYFFGHSPEWLIAATQQQLERGIEIGPQSAIAGDLARDICEFTGLDRTTFCNTGSEAVMAAIRLARTVTGRTRVAYFTGDYHGMFDEVLVRGSWVNGEYRAQPIAPGIPASLVENMLVLDYAAPESLEILRLHADELAAVLVEPVQSRQPGLQPRAFLRDLRALTKRAGVALIFDEVVTGFRCHPGGAQAWFGVEADMATYGKVLGGGIPIGVLAGKSKYLDALDGGAWNYGDNSFPETDMTFFAGTFVRHPLAMAAARAVIDYLREQGPGLQLRMNERSALFCRTLNEHFVAVEAPIRLSNFSAVCSIDYPSDLPFISLLWYYLREKGVHVWEGRPIYLTLAHTDEDFDQVIRAFKESVEEMQQAGFLPAATSVAMDQFDGFPRRDSAPTTEPQMEIWASARINDDANRAYNESNVITFHGPLDVPALKKAMLHLVQRHPALRSTFSEDGETQFFDPAPEHLEFPVSHLDLVPESDRQRRYAQWQTEGASLPFDLIQGPLFRTRLVSWSRTHNVLLFTAHHIVCDGWSFGMLVDELSKSYNAFLTDRVPLLPPPLAFGDYARDLCRQHQEGSNHADRDYWISLFQNGAPDLQLPTDRPRPLFKTYAGAMESHILDGACFERLKESAPRLGGTLFSTLLGVFATLLHRLSGQEEVVIGVPSAGQTLAACDELVGHCLNFLPLRLRCPADQSFQTFVDHVSQNVLDAYEHQGYTFGSLVHALKLPRDASRLPLVSVMFNIDRSGFDHLDFEGLKFQVTTNAKQFVNFDLFFNLVQSDERIEIECEYNTDLYNAATIRGWLAAYESLIKYVVDEAGKPLAELPILSASEQRELLAWNETARPYERELGIHEIFAAVASRCAAKAAVRCGDQSFTYAELALRSDHIAATLQSLGVQSGDLVGVCLERSTDMIAALLGIFKAGAAYVPLDPALPGERLAFMVGDAGLRALVTRTELLSVLPAHQAKTLLLDQPLIEAPLQVHHGGGEHPAYVMFTSGSTGRPKGVRIPHRALSNFLSSMRREPGLAPEDILFAVTTLSFDISGLEIFLPLTTGATVVIAPGPVLADGHLLRKELESSGATVMQATPASWRLLLEAGWSGHAKLKILIGGEAVPRELVNHLIPCCASIWNVYGPTETTIWSTVTQLEAGEESVSIGHPIDNTQVYVVNSSFHLQPVGVPGELLIGGDGLALDYLNRPDLTADRFIPNPFANTPSSRLYRTGDLARWRADGSLECLGRCDLQLKIRGYRIEPGEIESLLEAHPAVAQAVVVARAKGPDNVTLTAFITPKPDQATADLPEILRESIRPHLPAYMVPAAWVLEEHLPLTPNGKIDRIALAKRDNSMDENSSLKEFVPPRNDVEKTLAGIWQDVLGLGRVGITDDIFELGGDSIFIFKITARANRAGLNFSAATLFRQTTIADLSAHLAKASAPVATAEKTITRLDRSAYRRKT